MYFLLTQTMYHPVFILQETSDKPLYTFTVTIRYWPRVKMVISAVDPGSSHNIHLYPLLFSHPTPTPPPDSTFLLSSDPIRIHFILLRILVSTLYPVPTASTTALFNLSTLPSWPTHHPYFSIWHHLPTLLIFLLWFSSSSLLLPETDNEDQ